MQFGLSKGDYGGVHSFGQFALTFAQGHTLLGVHDLDGS